MCICSKKNDQWLKIYSLKVSDLPGSYNRFSRKLTAQFCGPGKEAAMGIIVASLADFGHPDVTLESGLVPHTCGQLSLRYKLTSVFCPFHC